jgi:hypothetical protein
MALNLEGLTDNIEVIVKIDPAVHCTDEDYELYLQDNDESRLNLNGEEPTRFVMKKLLDFRAQEKISKSMISADVSSGRPDQMNLNISGMPELRATLIDIKNPGSPGLEFRKDKDDNLVSRELIAMLNSVGAADQLLAARRNAVQNVQAVSKKS